MMNEDSSSPAGASRRDVLPGGLSVAVLAGLPKAASAQTDQTALPPNPNMGTATMSRITTKDGTEILYKG